MYAVWVTMCDIQTHLVTLCTLRVTSIDKGHLITEYRLLAERRPRGKALSAFVRTSFGRKLLTGPLAHLDRRWMRARELDGDERVEPWDYINDHFAGYALYQGAVTRRIPVMVLESRE
jgi:hypothetical protein